MPGAMLGNTGRFAVNRTCGGLAVAVAGLLLLAALLAPDRAMAQKFPQLTGRVVDAANVIPADVEARLDQKLAALETQSRRQLVIATVPDLQGYDIADYGYRLGRSWGIGGKERNDGALLIVAPHDRKLRIEVGYGLEGIVTDGLSSLIISQAIVPQFKAGNMAGGIEAGTDALIRQLTLPEEEARKVAAQAAKARPASSEVQFPGFMFLLFLFFFVILPIMRRAGGRRYASALGPVIVWDVLNHMGGGRSGGGNWGGGFSGGGGSFGGGGSSGSW